MKPEKVVKFLHFIASEIERNSKPSRKVTVSYLNQVIAALDESGISDLVSLLDNIRSEVLVGAMSSGGPHGGIQTRQDTEKHFSDYTGKKWIMNILNHEVVVEGIGPMLEGVFAYNFEIRVSVDGLKVFEGGSAEVENDIIDAVNSAISKDLQK